MDSLVILAVAIVMLSIAVVIGVFGYCFLQFQKEIFTQNNLNARSMARIKSSVEGNNKQDAPGLESILLPVLMEMQNNGGNININDIITKHPEILEQLLKAGGSNGLS